MRNRILKRTPAARLDGKLQYEIDALLLLNQHGFEIIIRARRALELHLAAHERAVILLIGELYAQDRVHDRSALFPLIDNGKRRRNDKSLRRSLRNGKVRHFVKLQNDFFPAEIGKYALSQQQRKQYNENNTV